VGLHSLFYGLHLYELLKNIIYLLVMEELGTRSYQEYQNICDEIKQKYKMYITLRKTIEKCKD